MKKKTVYLCGLALAVLTFSLAACGGKGADSGQNAGTDNSQTENGAAAGSPVDGAPDNSAPVENIPAQDGDAADGEMAGWSEEMTALRDAVVAELGDKYWPNMEIPVDVLEMSYGLTSDMYEDYMGEMPMMSVQVDTLLIVKAKAGQEEAVEQALNAYRDNLVSNTMQYPSNLGKIQASKVERIGSYVCFALMGGDITAIEEKGEEAVILYCQEQNDRVIETISENIEQ